MKRDDRATPRRAASNPEQCGQGYRPPPVDRQLRGPAHLAFHDSSDLMSDIFAVFAVHFELEMLSDGCRCGCRWRSQGGLLIDHMGRCDIAVFQNWAVLD